MGLRGIFWWSVRGLLAFALLSFLVGMPARAEQLVMPFSCSMSDGYVDVRPSAERSYQILGSRAQHVFTVCAPNNRNRCRNWKIHKFVVDCDGQPVPWIKIIDAASGMHGKRVWLDGGLLNIEVGPGNRILSYGADTPRRFGRPRAGPYGRGPEFRRRLGRSVVQLPPGFAPTLGLPVRFEGGPGGVSGSFNAVEGPPPIPSEAGQQTDTLSSAEQAFLGKRGGDQPTASAAKATENEKPDSSKIPLPVPKPKLAKRPVEPKSAASDKKKIAQAPSAPKPSGPNSAKSDGAGDSEPTVGAKNAGARDNTERKKGPIVPTLINAPSNGSDGDAKEATPDADPSVSKPVAGDKSQSASDDTTKETDPQVGSSSTAGVAADVSGESTIKDVGLVSGQGSPQASASQSVPGWGGSVLSVLVLLAGAAGLFAGGLFFFRMRKSAGSGRTWERDYSRVDLKSAGGLGDMPLRTGKDVAVAGQPGAVSADGADVASAPVPVSEDANGSPAERVAISDLRIPTTREEALLVVGASADAAIEVIKKIVDGLRQSWHPDLAKNDGDRLYRERRMQQINVAWDIIVAHQRAHAKAAQS